MTTLPLYWIRSQNFGDALNPIIYEYITDQYPKIAQEAESPKILAIGSIMLAALPGDTVWGTGCIREKSPLYCNDFTHFKAVRGPLTAMVLRDSGINLGDVPFGDPAILLPRFIPRSKPVEGRIGFLPHYVDADFLEIIPSEVFPIKPMTDTATMLGKIMTCEILVTSSLHGIVVAEAYGIPAIWVELSDNVAGGGFKFRDYYAVTGRTIKPLDWRSQWNWQDVISIASDRVAPVMNTNDLLEACPFRQGPMFDEPSLSCQIPTINLFYEKYLHSRGVFVEVGGNDGYTWSNTWHLANMGWHGIYYEPDEKVAKLCQVIHSRNDVKVIQSCVGHYNGETRLYHGNGATTNHDVASKDIFGHSNNINDFEYSRIITLNKSLSEEGVPEHFDLLVIDVNGDEPLVLTGLDLEKWKPTMIIIATHKNHDGWNFNVNIIYRMLSPWYAEVYSDHINSIFVRDRDL